MSITLFLRLSRRPYERIVHKLGEKSFSTCTVGNLKKFIVGELLKDYSKHAGVELVYCGSVLDDSADLNTEGIKPGCTIHVFEKDDNSESELVPLTEESIKCAVVAYRRILIFCHGNGFPKIICPEVLSKIVGKYPEFYNDVGAFAILKDGNLLIKMVRSRHARSIGEQYPVMINAAVFIADTIINYLKTNKSLQSAPADTSDVEMSEDSSSQDVEDQRVSRSQLAAALLSATSASNFPQRASIGPSSSIQSSNNSRQYVAELQTMREMGLAEENSNLQALILCNGNVEEAINLVVGRALHMSSNSNSSSGDT